MITLTGGGIKSSKKTIVPKKQVSEDGLKNTLFDEEDAENDQGFGQPDNEYL